MKLTLLNALLFFFLTVTLTAQNAKITGSLKIEGSLHSVSDAYVYLSGTSLFGISNAEGKFEINDVPAGDYTLNTSIIGYEESQHQITISTGSELVLSLFVSEAINNLPLVKISSQSGTGGLLGALNLPGSTHFISKKELQQFNTTNIHQILQNVPGVQIQEEDGFGLRPNIGLRGTGSERSSKITILEDGILAAPAPYAAPSAYYFPTVARMEAIEIMKGASQIKYGPFTTGGVINLISTSIPNQFSGNLNLGVGSFGMRQLRANLGDKIGNFSFVVDAMQSQSNGFKTISAVDQDTGFDKKDWLAKVEWESGENSNFYQSIQFKYAETREISNETYLGITRTDLESDPYQRYAASQKDKMTTNHRQVNLHYLINPVKNLYFQTTAYQNNFFRNWYKLDKVQNAVGIKTSISSLLNDPSLYPTEFSLVNGRTSQQKESLEIKANNRNYISRGLQSKLNYIKGQQAVELGFRAHYDEMDRFQWVDNYQMHNNKMELISTGIPGSESNRIESAMAYSTYLKYELNFNKFMIDFGLRNENIEITRLDYGNSDTERAGDEITERSNSVNVFIPGASVKYDFSKSHQMFAGVHRGFSPPGSTPDTAPELSINYEIGYRIQKSALFGSAVLFRNNYSNLLGADLASSGGIGSGDLFNGGASVAQGIELALSYKKQITKSYYIPVSLQYTYTDARFSSTFESEFEPWGNVTKNDQLPYLAKNTFNLRSGLNSSKLSTSFSANYLGAMRTFAGSGTLVDEDTVDSRWILNIDCSVNISKMSSLTFAVRNITNKAYIVANRPAGWRPGAPRIFSLTINNRF